MCGALLILAASFLVRPQLSPNLSAFLAVASLCVYVAFFAVSWGPLGWVMNAGSKGKRKGGGCVCAIG